MSEKKPENYRANEDCFAYRIDGRGKGKCDCLSDLYCAVTDCGFYKTKDEVREERLKSRESKFM